MKTAFVYYRLTEEKLSGIERPRKSAKPIIKSAKPIISKNSYFLEDKQWNAMSLLSKSSSDVEERLPSVHPLGLKLE